MIHLNAIKLIGLSLIMPLLAACGDSKISAVKDTRLRGDEFTVGETLSKIKECKSTEWNSEVVNNATMVTHTCTVKLDDELRDLAKQGELAALKTRSELADLSVTQALSQARNVHATAVRYSQERITLATRRLAELDQRIERGAAAVYSPFISMRGLPTTTNAPDADRPA